MRRTLFVFLAAVLATVGATAMAQDNYPSRPVKIIAPQAPGGGVDLFAAEALSVMPMTPPQFGKYIADEIAHWTAVARASKIEAE